MQHSYSRRNVTSPWRSLPGDPKVLNLYDMQSFYAQYTESTSILPLSVKLINVMLWSSSMWCSRM